jgi:hypothetical protein
MTALGHAREPIAMPTVSREDVIKVGQDIKVGKDEEALWPVSDDEAWRARAREFIEDEALVRRASGQIRGFNLTPTSGPALVDLLIQAHVGDDGDRLKRMSKGSAESFNVETVKFKLKKRRARALAGEPCQGTTLRGEGCRNPGKYDGFCCLHAPKCQFHEVTGKRCTTRAVDGDLCPKHAHRQYELDEERKNLVEQEQESSTASPGGSSQVIIADLIKPSLFTPSPSRRVCKGKKLKVGKKRSDEAEDEDCGALAMKGSDYCRHHQDQSPILSPLVNTDVQEEQKLVSVAADLAETSESVETSTFTGESTSPSVKAKRTCHGKSRITGLNCGQRALKESDYCRFHQDQDPHFETDQLATSFTEIRDIQEQKEAVEILDDIDEYAVASYTLTKKSNNRLSKLTSAFGLSEEKTRRVDLTIYSSGVVFLYPDVGDNEEGKILGKFKLENLKVEVRKTRSSNMRTLRFNYLRGDGAPHKDFVNVKRETAQEIENIVDALKKKDISKARELADGSSKEGSPYLRWFNQVKDTALVDTDNDLCEILYGRNGQLDNRLEDGFVEEIDEDGKTVFWWGVSRNNRTGRKIGSAEDRKKFCEELRSVLMKDICVEDSAMVTEGPFIDAGDARVGDQEEVSGTKDEALKIPSYHDWFEAAVDECKQKAALVGEPDNLEYQHALTALLTKKFLMDTRQRLVSELNAFQRDGVYWWDPDCQKFPIGSLQHLELFSAALEKVFPDHYGPRSENTNGLYVHVESKRPSWRVKTKNESWDKLRNPVSGVLCQAFASAFNVVPASNVPAFVNDQDVPDSEFRVDMYGNVVAKPGTTGLANFSVCCTQYDHVLPWSRGGTSKSANVEVISWIANQRKSNHFLHGTDYVRGWSVASRPLKNIGLTVEQFVSLWVDVRDNIEQKKGKDPRLPALRSSNLGKKLVEDILYKTCAEENSWKSYQDVLNGGSTNANGDYEQILPGRPRGALLKRLLALFATADDAEGAMEEARKKMYETRAPHALISEE